MSDVLRSRIQGCLVGVQIGDAMGMPWEGMSHERIMKATDGAGVQTFHDAVQRWIKDTLDLKAGDTTDDWCLTRAVARSLVRRRGYDEIDCAREFVCAFEGPNVGWGKTTTRTFVALQQYLANTQKVDGVEQHFTAPEAPPGEGLSNGVAIRIASFALFYLPNRLWSDVSARFCKMIMDHGALTHPDRCAAIAAYTVALMIGFVVRRFGRWGSQEPIDQIHAPLLLYAVLREVDVAERLYPHARHGDAAVSVRLRRLSGAIQHKDPALMRKAIGSGFFVLESVPFAIGTFVRHPTDFRAGILEAVNAGGDTDSTASMVGAMIGANVGVEGIPEEWRTFRPEFREALELGEKLYGAAMECRDVL